MFGLDGVIKQREGLDWYDMECKWNGLMSSSEKKIINLTQSSQTVEEETKGSEQKS